MNVVVLSANPGKATHVATAKTASLVGKKRRHTEYQAAIPMTARTATESDGTHGKTPKTFRNGQIQKI